MRITTWNVNGIRAATKNGFLKWLAKEEADVICLQETKATEDQLDFEIRAPKGYESHWFSAEKAGYSGTALYLKKEPLDVVRGIGIPEIDREGRVVFAEYKNVVVASAYFPNSQRDHARLGYKLQFCEAMYKWLEKWRKKGKDIVLCGDFNIAHREIDLRNPKSNQDNAGFLPEERAWMDFMTDKGYVDAFRKFEPGGGHYTWWSYRPGVREKNVGWRIDYHLVNPEASDRLKSCVIQSEVMGSDHCPVRLEIKD